MSRRSWILFLIPVLVWSTTFYAITLQLGSVTTPTYAVALRFGAAGMLLFAWLLIRGDLQKLTAATHFWTALSGVCAYGVSYVLTYVAEESISSGLVAIAYTLMVFLTPALARLAYGTAITRHTWLGGSLGVLGVMLCFLPDMLNTNVSSSFLWGMGAMVIAALVSSIGAVCSMRLNQLDVAVTSYTAWAMLYGAAATFAYGVITRQDFHLDDRPLFWLAFVYLTIAGTLLTFLCYLHLLKSEGSARTMYISVLSPIGAVIVSILIEGLKLQALTALGMASALAGAWITLQDKRA